MYKKGDSEWYGLVKGLASEFEFKFKFMLTSNCWLNVKKLRKLGFAVEIGWLEPGRTQSIDGNREAFHTRR